MMQTVSCQLRPAAATDFELVYLMYFHEANNPYLLYDPMSREAFLPVYQELLAQGVKFILESEGQAVGMVKLVPQTHRTRHVCYVGGLAIHPEQHGRGWGRLLLQQIQAWASDKGFTRLELDVDEDNPRAMRLYQQAGFEVEGVLRNLAFRQTDQRYYHNYRMACLLDQVKRS